MDDPLMSVDVWSRAARHPDAPPRLVRAADAVLDGKFSWDDVASGQCQHPLARALYTAKGRYVVGLALRSAAAEAETKRQPEDATPRRRARQDMDEDLSQRTYLR